MQKVLIDRQSIETARRDARGDEFPGSAGEEGAGKPPRNDVTALILAGGKASRLGGIDKRQIVVGGRTIFERQIAALTVPRPLVGEIIVSARQLVPGFRTVLDDVAEAGPLAGIAAGLAAAATPWLFVLAGDMPSVEPPLIELMLARADATSDAVGIRIGGRPEPLCSALRVAFWRPLVESRLAAGRLGVAALLLDEPARVRWIEDGELRAIDPELRCLRSVNTPDDL